MNQWKSPPSMCVPTLLLAFAVFGTRLAAGDLHLGPEQSVQAGGSDIDVPGYSVPSYACWDGDELKDLIVGEGDGTYTPKVRVYVNVGTAGSPQFGDFFHAQSDGADLTVPGSGCLGLFPRVVYWDADDRKDLLIGQADGKIRPEVDITHLAYVAQTLVSEGARHWAAGAFADRAFADVVTADICTFITGSQRS